MSLPIGPDCVLCVDTGRSSVPYHMAIGDEICICPFCRCSCSAGRALAQEAQGQWITQDAWKKAIEAHRARKSGDLPA